MANISYIETTKSKLDSIAIEAGQRIICTDTGEEYYDDTHGNRVYIGDNIKNKVNEVSTQLNAKMKYVTPQQFGAVGDGVTDDTESIINMFNYANENNLSVQSDSGKTYIVNNTINIISNMCIDFNNSTIKCTKDLDVLFAVDKDNGTITDIKKFYQLSLKNITLDCNNFVEVGIGLNHVYSGNIENIKIYNHKKAGIETAYVGTNGSITVNNIYIFGNLDSQYGVLDNGKDNSFNNVTCIDCITGFKSINGVFNHCWVWISNSKNYSTTVGWEIGNGQIRMSNCTIDTLETGIYDSTGYSVVYINNTRVINNNAVVSLDDTNKIVFKGTADSRFIVNGIDCDLNKQIYLCNVKMPKSTFNNIKTNYEFKDTPFGLKYLDKNLGYILNGNMLILESFDGAFDSTSIKKYETITLLTLPYRIFSSISTPCTIRDAQNVEYNCRLKIELDGTVKLENNNNVDINFVKLYITSIILLIESL